MNIKSYDFMLQKALQFFFILSHNNKNVFDKKINNLHSTKK
jgi:hypothetical protein